jgi:hypothetical protein
MPDIARMSLADRLGVVVRRAAALVPGDAGRRLAQLASPEALAIMAGMVAIWAASHFVGFGEIADVALLVGGWLTIGAGAVAGCRKLLSFGLGTYDAWTEEDPERLAPEFAGAVGIFGVDVALGLLFMGRPKARSATRTGARCGASGRHSLLLAGHCLLPTRARAGRTGACSYVPHSLCGSGRRNHSACRRAVQAKRSASCARVPPAELHRTVGLLLHYNGWITNASVRYRVKWVMLVLSGFLSSWWLRCRVQVRRREVAADTQERGRRLVCQGVGETVTEVQACRADAVPQQA